MNTLLYAVPGLTRAKGLALALQAHDPHTMEFTLAILRLHENDFLDNLKRKWWESSNECPQEQDTSKETQSDLSLRGVVHNNQRSSKLHDKEGSQIHSIEKTLSCENDKPSTMRPNGFMCRCVLSFAYSKCKTVLLFLL